MSTTPDNVIVCKGISKTYLLGRNITVPALKPTDLSIQRGDYIAIIGPSGSGKSTMMNILGCLDAPSTGRLYIEGIDISTLHDNQLAEIRREKIGFIFQKYNLIPTLNAVNNVGLGMSFAGVPYEERMRRSKELLQMVHLEHRFDHKPNEMSGGEQQRVAIARSLGNRPSILLADEPTGNVDTAAGDEIMDMLEEINKRGETIIVVTHDPDIAARAQRVLNITDGVVREK